MKRLRFWFWKWRVRRLMRQRWGDLPHGLNLDEPGWREAFEEGFSPLDTVMDEEHD